MAKTYTKSELEAKIKNFEVSLSKASSKDEKDNFSKGLAIFKKKLEAFGNGAEKEIEKIEKPKNNRGSRKRKRPVQEKPTSTTKKGTWQDFVKANKGSGKGLKELSKEWKGGKSTPTKAKAPTKTAPAKTGKGKKSGISVVNTKVVMVDGKEMKMDSAEFCSILLDKWKSRRNKSKTSGGKKKTTSVMSRVTTNIEKGIKQAITGGVSKQKKAITKNPTQFFNKIDTLENSTKKFLSSLKAVMGAEYEQSDIAKTMKEIESFVAELKSKFEK